MTLNEYKYFVLNYRGQVFKGSSLPENIKNLAIAKLQLLKRRQTSKFFIVYIILTISIMLVVLNAVQSINKSQYTDIPILIIALAICIFSFIYTIKKSKLITYIINQIDTDNFSFIIDKVTSNMNCNVANISTIPIDEEIYIDQKRYVMFIVNKDKDSFFVYSIV